MEFFLPIAVVFVAYLIGSISSAILVCRLFRLPDPRNQGSKNPGATNVLRIGGKIPAALTLLGDGLKAFIPVIVFSKIPEIEFSVGFIALGAMVGHLFPIFFQFKGGKGVATFFGALWGLHWIFGVLFCFIWVCVAGLTRYSSLAALVATFVIPLFSWYFDPFLTLPLSIMAILIILRHKTNIQKLLSGMENKIGAKKII